MSPSDLRAAIHTRVGPSRSRGRGKRISDLCAAAGIHPTGVYRFLNGQQRSMSPEAEVRLWAVVGSTRRVDDDTPSTFDEAASALARLLVQAAMEKIMGALKT